MDDYLLTVYLEQAKRECEEAFRLIDQLNRSVQEADVTAVMSSAQSLVQRAAAVSRLFWPPGPRDKTARARCDRRGLALRQATALNGIQDHPVKTRALRDHIEHFDERLDDWAEQSQNRNIIINYVGPRSGIGGDAIGDRDIVHHYDPSAKIYAFRGEKFDLQALAHGLHDIYERADRRIKEIRQASMTKP